MENAKITPQISIFNKNFEKYYDEQGSHNKDYIRNGFGILTTDDDVVYEGIWVNGDLPTGICKYKNGDRYEGQFLNGQRGGLVN